MRFLLFFLVCLFSLTAHAQNIQRTVCQGNMDRLDSLLIEEEVTVLDNRGRSLLHWAVACKQKEVFDFLVKEGLNINAQDFSDETPMHIAVRFGNKTFYDLLVELQMNEDWKMEFGPSLLEIAVLEKDTIFVHTLLENDIDLNATNERGSTPLEISYRMNANDISKMLLEYGADQSKVRRIHLTGKFMAENPSESQSKMFAPNFISTEEQEFGSTFNDAGTEFFYAVDVNGKYEIRTSVFQDGFWSKPKVILSHEVYGYNDPILTPDESQLYFISNRALDGISDKKDIDIWYVNRTNDGWSTPINAGSNINSSDNEYYISFTHEGTMYFSSNINAPDDRKNNDYDIYAAQFINGEYQKPKRLSDAINTQGYEADVFVSPYESYLIFCSTRDSGFGKGDLFISFKKTDGNWTEAKNMGKEINTENYEYCPFVTGDGKHLLFTSNQDIYWISTALFQRWK